MGKLINFPVVRRHPHVALAWDPAWDQYRVETTRYAGPSLLEWHSDYGIALDALITLGRRLDLPMVDLTNDGQTA